MMPSNPRTIMSAFTRPINAVVLQDFQIDIKAIFIIFHKQFCSIQGHSFNVIYDPATATCFAL